MSTPNDDGDSKHEANPPPEDAEDLDRAAILARRNRLLAMVLAGTTLSSAQACEVACLSPVRDAGPDAGPDAELADSGPDGSQEPGGKDTGP